MFNFTANPPLSLYVHMPWCVRKCPYCDFNSHTLPGKFPEQAYIDALLADLEQDLPAVWGRVVTSVFIGGGTPSLFTPAAIDRLLSGIRARIALDPQAEITLEANPGAVDAAHFQGYHDAGVNRLSIGVQRFQDKLLERIGRIHDAHTARVAAEAAHAAGFENINLDLMFGLPGQTREQAEADLQIAVDLQPTHLSWYELTIEPNTWFHRHPPKRPDDSALWSMQTGGQARLLACGFEHYEVSAFARPGRQCRHNVNYWRFGDYLGIGAGAHGKITLADRQQIIRLAKTRHPQRYLECVHRAERVSSTTVLSAEDAAFEYVMNALRLTEGFTSEAFAAATGLAFACIEAAAGRALEAGLLTRHGQQLQASPRGQRFLNELLQYWLPEPSVHAERC